MSIVRLSGVLLVTLVFTACSTPAATDVATERSQPDPTVIAARATITPEPEPTATPVPPTPTATPIPPTPTPADPYTAMVDRIRAAYRQQAHAQPGPSVQEIRPGVIHVSFQSRTTSLSNISLWIDSGTIIQAAYESSYPLEYITLEATADLIDQYGNTEQGTVMRLGMPRATYERINWEHYEGLNYKQLPEVSEDVFIHPALE